MPFKPKKSLKRRSETWPLTSKKEMSLLSFRLKTKLLNIKTKMTRSGKTWQRSISSTRHLLIWSNNKTTNKKTNRRIQAEKPGRRFGLTLTTETANSVLSQNLRVVVLSNMLIMMSSTTTQSYTWLKNVIQIKNGNCMRSYMCHTKL